MFIINLEIIAASFLIVILSFKYHDKKLFWVLGIVLTLSFGWGGLTFQASEALNAYICPDGSSLCSIETEITYEVLEKSIENEKLISLMKFISFNFTWGWMIWPLYFVTLLLFSKLIVKKSNA